MAKPFGVLKTTALGGLLFLLPLIVIGALVGGVVPFVLALAQWIGDRSGITGAAGYAILVGIAIGIVVVACFLAGLVTRHSFGRRFSGWLERNLELFFPRYVVIREQMLETVRDGSLPSTLKPVLVTFDDHRRLAFETDRAGDDAVVFLPAAPDPWSGEVVIVPVSRVAPLAVDLTEAMATCKRLGRGSVRSMLGSPRT